MKKSYKPCESIYIYIYIYTDNPLKIGGDN